MDSAACLGQAASLDLLYVLAASFCMFYMHCVAVLGSVDVLLHHGMA